MSVPATEPTATAPAVVVPPTPVAPPPAPPAPPAPVAPAPAFDPRTGDPNLMAQPANDPAGVWGPGVVPAATPPTGVAAPPVTQVPAPTLPQGQPYVEFNGQRFYTEEYLEQARSQERDKMHTRLASVEQLLANQEAERQAELEAERQRAAQEAAEQEAQRLAGLSGDERLQEMATRLEQTIQQHNEQMARRDALDQQERRYNELTAYRARRVGEESDLIHPTLVDLVVGPEQGATSEQQIEESIAAIKAKTDAIVGTLRQEQVVARQQMPGVAPTGAPPSAGPLDLSSGYQQVTSADIAAMDPATYAKNRPALMAAMRQSVAERGLYG